MNSRMFAKGSFFPLRSARLRATVTISAPLASRASRISGREIAIFEAQAHAVIELVTQAAKGLISKDRIRITPMNARAINLEVLCIEHCRRAAQTPAKVGRKPIHVRAMEPGI